jgi:nicotinamidase-related amidase
VRSLADESFNVVVVEDCCAAATMHLHRHELEVINMIYLPRRLARRGRRVLP